MKYILALVLLFLNLLFANSAPSWFYNTDGTLNESANQIIGYGTSDSITKARMNAMRDIAETVSSKVTSELKINKISDKNSYVKHIESSLNISTNEKINHVKPVRSEMTENGRWYIALSYDWTPFAIKFKKKLKGYKLRNQKQNNYLKYTQIIQNLNTVIGKNLDYKLYSKGGVWHIAYKDITFNLDNEEFNKLFRFTEDKYISIELNSDIYEHNDSLKIDVRTNKNGYVSLFYIGSRGQAALIQGNIKSKGQIHYPKDERIDLKNNSGEEKKFMIVAFFSNKKIKTKLFDKISRKRINNTSFEELLKLFDKYRFATYSAQIL
jgi:hypothetical protein